MPRRGHRGGERTRSSTPLPEGAYVLAVPLSQGLLVTYLPATFTSTDYPALVPPGQAVGTVPLGAGRERPTGTPATTRRSTSCPGATSSAWTARRGWSGRATTWRSRTGHRTTSATSVRRWPPCWCKGRRGRVPARRRENVPVGRSLKLDAGVRRLGGSAGVDGGLGLPAPPPAAGPQAVALAVHLEDVDVMREPIEQRARQALRTKHCGMPRQRNG